MKSFERRKQVAQALKREIAQFIQSGALKDDRVSPLLSILEVEMNPSLSAAIVKYSIIGSEDDPAQVTGTQAALDDKASYIRGVVARKINLKYAPKLIFNYSDSLKKGFDVINLINEAIKTDESSHEKD